MEEKIQAVIKEINPYLNSDGGNIEFIKLEDNKVYIRLTGACQGCDYRDITIKNVILNMIQEEVPQITDVIAI